jgi:hypothetical protein
MFETAEKHAHCIAQYGIWPYADALQKIKDNDPLVPLFDATYAFVTEYPLLVLLPYCKARYAEETGITTFHEAFVYLISTFSGVTGIVTNNTDSTLFPHAQELSDIPDLADLGQGEPGQKSIEYIGTVVSYMEEKQKHYQQDDPVYAEWIAAIQN